MNFELNEQQLSTHKLARQLTTNTVMRKELTREEDTVTAELL